MGWVSPTGFNDPSGDWADEGNAYDEDTESYATNSELDPYATSGNLELTHASLSCSKVRTWAYPATGYLAMVVDVYYGGDWHNIFAGTPTDGDWQEHEIGSTQDVTALRVNFNNSDENPHTPLVYEADFWEVEVVVGRSFGYIMGQKVKGVVPV